MRLLAAVSPMVAVIGLITSLSLVHPALVHPAQAQSGEGAAAAAGKTEDLYALEQQLEELHETRGANYDGHSERNALANRILKLDAESAIAHQVLGDSNVKQFLQYRQLQRRKPNRRLQARVERHRDRAIEHLERSLVADPGRPSIYRDFIRFLAQTRQFKQMLPVVDVMRSHLPYERDTWLYSGLAAINANQTAAAAEYFDRAFVFMDASARADFLGAEMLLSSEEKRQLEDEGPDTFWQAYWKKRQPGHLSDANQRLLVHYERVVLCDLLYPYWRTYAEDEWQITPAEVVFRYGLPRDESGWLDADEKSRQLTISTKHGSFLFTDWTRNGEYLAISTVSTNSAFDPVSKLRGLFRRLPEEHSIPAGTREVPVSFLATQLRANEPNQPRRDADNNLLIVTSGVSIVPASGEGGVDGVTARTGAFVLNAAGEVISGVPRTFRGMNEDAYVNTPDGSLWCTVTRLDPTSASNTLSVEFELVDAPVVGRSTAEFKPRALDGDSLMISDVLLANLITEDARVPGQAEFCSVRRGGLDIRPIPSSLLSRKAPVYLYVETYNLFVDAGGTTRSSVEVALRDIVSRDGNDRVATRIEVSGAQRDSGDYLILDLADEEPGEYALAVRVTDLLTGESRESARTIYVR